MDYTAIVCATLSFLSAVTVAAITVIGNSKSSKQKRLAEQEKAQKKANDEQERSINKTINDGLKTLRTEVIKIRDDLEKRIEETNSKLAEQKESIKVLKAGEQASLRNDLLALHEKCIEKKFATISEKDNFENMYQSYHALGKNGVMNNNREEMMKLPQEKPDNN